MIDGIFEIAMLLCFASAWPFSIYRSYKHKSTLGKSLMFMVILEIGYMMGIINKFVSDDINYVLYFYIFNIILVAIDISLYFRNRNYEKRQESSTSI